MPATTTRTGRIAPTPKKQRELHPRAQLRYHHTCANRAQHKADWLRELADRWDADSSDDKYGPPTYAADNRAEAVRLDEKVREHLRACVVLNDAHDLGHFVSLSQRQMLGF